MHAQGTDDTRLRTLPPPRSLSLRQLPSDLPPTVTTAKAKEDLSLFFITSNVTATCKPRDFLDYLRMNEYCRTFFNPLFKKDLLELLERKEVHPYFEENALHTVKIWLATPEEDHPLPIKAFDYIHQIFQVYNKIDFFFYILKDKILTARLKPQLPPGTAEAPNDYQTLFNWLRPLKRIPAPPFPEAALKTVKRILKEDNILLRELIQNLPPQYKDILDTTTIDSLRIWFQAAGDEAVPLEAQKKIQHLIQRCQDFKYLSFSHYTPFTEVNEFTLEEDPRTGTLLLSPSGRAMEAAEFWTDGERWPFKIGDRLLPSDLKSRITAFRMQFLKHPSNDEDYEREIQRITAYYGQHFFHPILVLLATMSPHLQGSLKKLIQVNKSGKEEQDSYELVIYTTISFIKDINDDSKKSPKYPLDFGLQLISKETTPPGGRRGLTLHNFIFAGSDSKAVSALLHACLTLLSDTKGLRLEKYLGLQRLFFSAIKTRAAFLRIISDYFPEPQLSLLDTVDAALSPEAAARLSPQEELIQTILVHQIPLDPFLPPSFKLDARLPDIKQRLKVIEEQCGRLIRDIVEAFFEKKLSVEDIVGSDAREGILEPVQALIRLIVDDFPRRRQLANSIALQWLLINYEAEGDDRIQAFVKEILQAQQEAPQAFKAKFITICEQLKRAFPNPKCQAKFAEAFEMLFIDGLHETQDSAPTPSDTLLLSPARISREIFKPRRTVVDPRFWGESEKLTNTLKTGINILKGVSTPAPAERNNGRFLFFSRRSPRTPTSPSLSPSLFG